MNTLKPKAPFQALIMSEESRLGREQIQTAFALQQITDAGVRVWYYLNDQERKLDTAMDKIMGSLAGFSAEMERERPASAPMTRCSAKRRRCTSPATKSLATTMSPSMEPR